MIFGSLEYNPFRGLDGDTVAEVLVKVVAYNWRSMYGQSGY